MVFMTVKEAKKYIKKLGLEKAHNAIQRIEDSKESVIETEELLYYTAFRLVKCCVGEHNDTYRVTLYILRYDGTAQFFFNEECGINGSRKAPLQDVREYADKFSADEDYMLMVEIKPNRYVLVSQM